jgi:hypothetical protein
MIRSSTHSYLKALIGSMALARRKGTNPAAAATKPRIANAAE